MVGLCLHEDYEAVAGSCRYHATNEALGNTPPLPQGRPYLGNFKPVPMVRKVEAESAATALDTP